MHYILALTQMLLVGVVTFFEYSKKSSSVFLWAMSFLMFSLMHVINIISSNLKYPIWVYNNASLFVIGFASLYLITRVMILRSSDAIRIPSSLQIGDRANDISATSKKFIKYSVIILLITMGYSIFTIVRVSGGLFESSWGAAYNYYSSQQYVSFDKLVMWFFLPCGSIFLYGLVSKNRKIIISTSLPILLFVLVSRNKADLLTLITGVISFYIVAYRNIKLKNIAILLAAGIISVYAIYALQTFRHLGTLSDIIGSISIFDIHKMILSRIFSGQGELSLINVFYHFVYYDNNFPNFGLGHTYLRMLLVFIPTRFSFGLKPTDFAISMGSAWMMDYNNFAFSTHPTFFGDVFANLGYLGILLGVLWAIIVYVLDRIADRNNIVLKLTIFNLFASNYILIGRGSVYNSFTSMAYGVLIIGLIYFISRVRFFKT